MRRTLRSHHGGNHRAGPIDNEETRSLLRAIHLQPGSADAYFSLGVAYLNDRRDKEAEAALSEAVRLNPHDEESLLQRGIARVRLGQAAAAVADLDAALELDPDDEEAYRARAEARLQLRDYAGTLDDCRQRASPSAPRRDGALFARHGRSARRRLYESDSQHFARPSLPIRTGRSFTPIAAGCMR